MALNAGIVQHVMAKINSLNLEIPQFYTIDTKLDYQGASYLVKVNIDLNAQNIYAVMYGVTQLMNVLNGEMCNKLRNKIGKSCYKCNTCISHGNSNINVSANVSLRVDL